MKDHHNALHTPDFIVGRQEITVDYEPGTATEIEFDDGYRVVLRKLERDYDPTDRTEATRVMHEGRGRGELITGLLYIDTAARDLCSRERLPATPLAQLAEDDLRLTRAQWDDLMASLA